MSSISPPEQTKSTFKRLPLKNVLKLTGQIGITGIKVFLWVLVAFGLANLLLIGYAIFRISKMDFSWTNMGILIAVIILAITCTLIACYLTYHYIILMIIKKVYLTLEQRSKISEEVIQRTAHIFNGQEQVPQAQLRQAVDWSIIVHRYYRSTPVFLQSGITQYLNRVPITRFIIDLKEDILADRQQLAAEKFRMSVDDFFEHTILGSPTNLWTWLLWLVNIVVLYVLITWGIAPL